MMLKVVVLPFVVLFMSACSPSLAPKESKKVYTDQKKSKHIEKKKVEKKRKVVVKSKKGNSKKPKMVKKIVKNIKKEKMFQSVTKNEATLLQKGPKKENCIICGMNLLRYYKTNHAAKLDGKNVQYCSLHCLAAHIKEGAELENPLVVDVKSLKFIPVTEAFYVVGSDVKGTMTTESKYAFKSLKDAKAFQKKHGGKILDFYSAWQEAKKDFKK